MNIAILDNTNICSICITEINNTNSTNIFTTPCNHSFHINCLFPWVCRNNYSCPNCRAPILCNDEQLSELIDNHFYQEEELHEDIAYSLMLTDIITIINNIRVNRYNRFNISNNNNSFYTNRQYIFDYVYTQLQYLINSIRNINNIRTNINNNIFTDIYYNI